MFWLRPPIVAGRFYPRERSKLIAFLEETLEFEYEPQSAIGVMVPHAGYIYSGQIAADVYKKIHIPENVIILCPNHTGKGPRISVWSEGAWETPLGRIPIAEEIGKKILQRLSLKDGDMSAHAQEHAVEVHLPFLQYEQRNLKIVPIVLGHLSLEKCQEVGEALASIVEEVGRENCLLVASTDMSHYLPAEVARLLDAQALEQVKKLDPRGLYRTVLEQEISMCGFIPTTAVMEACIRLGAKESHLLSYADSGDVTGDKKAVVGYANAIFH